MPQRQQDSVCAQIIPCSSWLFSIFLNRHCTESGIRNGPVISLIASTDKSKWVNFFKDTTDSNPKCSSSGSQPSLPQWWGPSASPHPQAGQEPKWQKGLPLQTRPISTQWRPPLREEGQEVRDSMFLGICPRVTLKLTPSLIQNLTLGSCCATKSFCTPQPFSTAMYKLHMHTSMTVDTTNQPTESQIWQMSTATGVSVFPAFSWNSPNSFY